MRRKETRPTSIYWLVDVRPETIAAGWSNGRPFYCGKTVDSVERRFGKHRAKALAYPKRLLSKMTKECGDHIRIMVVAVVACDGDWIAAERHWIEQIRLTNPAAANVSNGGEGPAGIVRSAEFCANVSAFLTGRKLSAETRAKISASLKSAMTPERRIKSGGSFRGKTLSAEHRAKISAAKRGKRHSAETRAKISAALLRRREAPPCP